jgi:hypothetical protein
VIKVTGLEEVDPVKVVKKILGDVETGALKHTK